jgi:alpha-ribazole phosphatase
MDIILIRHGRTSANGMGLYCGRTDIGLSGDDSAEAAACADMLGEFLGSVDRVVTSGMKRTNETARLILGSDVQLYESRDLMEYDFGEFEMKGYDDLKLLPEYVEWIEDEMGRVSCPGGEDKSSFEKRVICGFENLLAGARRDGVSRMLVVSHGGPIVRIMDHLFPGSRNFYEWQPSYMKGYVVSISCEGQAAYSAL